MLSAVEEEPEKEAEKDNLATGATFQRPGGVGPSLTLESTDPSDLRFKVGNGVSCNVGGRGAKGVVVKLLHKHPSMPTGYVAAYLVRLNESGRCIAAPIDKDACIRADISAITETLTPADLDPGARRRGSRSELRLAAAPRRATAFTKASTLRLFVAAASPPCPCLHSRVSLTFPLTLIFLHTPHSPIHTHFLTPLRSDAPLRCRRSRPRQQRTRQAGAGCCR